MIHSPIPRETVDAKTRSFEIEHYPMLPGSVREGLDWRLRLTGRSVGGYGVLRGAHCDTFDDEQTALNRGRIWMQTGLLPAHQTDAHISAYGRADTARFQEAANG